MAGQAAVQAQVALTFVVIELELGLLAGTCFACVAADQASLPADQVAFQVAASCFGNSAAVHWETVRQIAAAAG